MSEEILRDHRALWEHKPTLRAIYHDYYRRILAVCHSGGITLEVGGGSGNLKAFAADVVSTDIVPTPWVDAAADAQSLPFPDGTFSNIVCVDVLHHIERPMLFLREAQRVLVPGGRLIMLEPAMTPLSWVFYKLLHTEPIDLSADPFVEGPLDPGRKPFDGNQAIPSLLFGRHLNETFHHLSILRPVSRSYLSLLAYPLSGGFRRWTLAPGRLVAPLLRFEDAVLPLLGPLMAFRLFVVLERSTVDCSA